MRLKLTHQNIIAYASIYQVSRSTMDIENQREILHNVFHQVMFSLIHGISIPFSLTLTVDVVAI